MSTVDTVLLAAGITVVIAGAGGIIAVRLLPGLMEYLIADAVCVCLGYPLPHAYNARGQVYHQLPRAAEGSGPRGERCCRGRGGEHESISD